MNTDYAAVFDELLLLFLSIAMFQGMCIRTTRSYFIVSYPSEAARSKLHPYVVGIPKENFRSSFVNQTSRKEIHSLHLYSLIVFDLFLLRYHQESFRQTHLVQCVYKKSDRICETIGCKIDYN